MDTCDMHKFFEYAIACYPESDLVVLVKNKFQIEVGEFEYDVIGTRAENDASDLLEEIEIKGISVKARKQRAGNKGEKPCKKPGGKYLEIVIVDKMINVNDEKNEIMVVKVKSKCVSWYQKIGSNERGDAAKRDDDLFRVQIIGFCV